MSAFPKLSIMVPKRKSSIYYSVDEDALSKTKPENGIEIVPKKPWIGDYYLSDIGQIGEGAFGSVVVANKQSGSKTTEHAVKYIYVGDDARSDKKRASILNEINVLSHLVPECNPYILCYQDHFPEDIRTATKVYIVSEYLKGYVELLKITGTLKTPEYYKLIHNMCAGLAVIHSKGVAHRDIKPENIMVSTHDYSIKYIDFGLAYLEGTTPAKLRDTIKGTLPYISGEIMNKPEGTKYTLSDLQKADVFALGIVIFELYTKYYPCSICTAASCSDRVLQKFNSIEDKPPSASINLFSALNGTKSCHPNFYNWFALNRVVTEHAAKNGKIFGYLPDMFVHGKLHLPGDPYLMELPAQSVAAMPSMETYVKKLKLVGGKHTRKGTKRATKTRRATR